MMVQKKIVCPDRLRYVPKQFSWIDQALVRKKYICGLSHESLSLYLFLLTVSDADGISYYSDASIDRYLKLDSVKLDSARHELCYAGLIAYSKPFYQVLSLQSSSDVLPKACCEESRFTHPRNTNADPVHVGTLLTNYLKGK